MKQNIISSFIYRHASRVSARTCWQCCKYAQLLPLPALPVSSGPGLHRTKRLGPRREAVHQKSENQSIHGESLYVICSSLYVCSDAVVFGLFLLQMTDVDRLGIGRVMEQVQDCNDLSDYYHYYYMTIVFIIIICLFQTYLITITCIWVMISMLWIPCSLRVRWDDLTWPHLISLDLTWHHLTSIDLT